MGVFTVTFCIMHEHHHDSTLVVLSVVIAIFASYTALDLASSISSGRGKVRWLWLIGGSLAMGVGIWSMHFIGMLAFSLPGINIYYDIPLVLLSILVAILASALALYLIGYKEIPGLYSYGVGSLLMGLAIAGMHYIGIWSMRMDAIIHWDYNIVALSFLVAVAASFGALFVAFRLRSDVSVQGFIFRGLGGSLMGFAIAGMHYTGMAAMHIIPTQEGVKHDPQLLLASHGLATAVIIGTILILSIALTGSNIDRALSKKTILNDALKEAIRARDEFMSVASHELRTPLTSIKLQNEMILRGVEHGDVGLEKIVTMLKKTDHNLNRINRLVDDMLDISRFSMGRLTFQKESFDLAQLTSEVIERLSPLAAEAGCEVIFHAPHEVVGSWDRFRVEQVITNLLTNSTKYAAGKPIKVEVTKENKFAKVSIKDQGRGIAQEDHERIFMRFERADHSQRGMGLGLFISKEIINMHAGQIRIKSEVGQGAEFIIELPFS